MRKITVKIGKPKPINANIEEPKDVEAVLRDVTLRRTSGTTNHDELTGRDLPNQHPMSSVEGLELALDKKQPVGNYALKKEIPSKTSELENDNEFITKTVNNLANYYLKAETYSKEELNNKISSIPKFSIEVVSSLPTTNISTTTVYLIASGDEQDNLYTEYIYVDGAWEYLGKQSVDLTGYVKRTELSSYYTKTDIDALIETIRSSIPTKLSQLTEDARHRLVSDSEKQSWNNKQPAGDYVTNTELNAKDFAKQTDVNKISEEIADLVLIVSRSDFEEFTEEELMEKFENGTRILIINDDSENLIPASISPNGSVFNGCGYLTGNRLNSSGSIVATDNAVVTGYMPFTYGKTILINGALSEASYGGQYIATYNQNFELIGVFTISGLIDHSSGSGSVQLEDNTYEHKLLTNSFTSTTYSNAFKNASYIRISVNPCLGENLSVIIE